MAHAAPATVAAPPEPVLRFGEQAVEMERFALWAGRRPQSPDERNLTDALLRHARGVRAIAEKWRSLTY